MTVERARWLSPGVVGIGLASFLSDVGHEVPTSLLPALLVATLGSPAAALGLIEGFANGAAGMVRLLGGALADDPGRRRTVATGGYVGTAILSAFIGAAVAAWQVGAFRIGAWVSRGLRVPPRNALLADPTSPDGYGRVYGFARMMDNLGAVVGPLLALALVSIVGVRSAILLSVIPGLLAARAIVYAIRHIPRPKAREGQPIRLQLRPVRRGRLGRLMLGVTAFELGNVAATLLILRATTLLEPGRSHTLALQLALGLYVSHNVAAALMSIPAGKAGDRWSALSVLAVGVGFFHLAYLGFAIGKSDLIPLGLSFVGAGVGTGCIETAQHASVATLAPAEVRGSAFGVLAGIQGFGNLAASGIAGLLWSLVSGSVAFLYLVIWMVLAFAHILAAGRYGPRYAT